jgi:transmembrane sensor
MKTFGSTIPWDEDDAISIRAADFFARRRFGAWTNADQAQLDAWLAESALHEVAYLRLIGIANSAEDLFSLRAPRQARSVADEAARILARRFGFPLLIAASIALIGALGYPFVASLMQPPDRAFSTEIGDHTLLKFADGTEVELNTDSAMRYRMTTAERIVWLEKGEAWFRIAHNAANPFTVVVGKHRVTDLGTEFAVHRDGDDVEVRLMSGRAMLNTAGASTTMLVPGDDALATPVSVSVTRKTPQELADELAWRRGWLVFRKTTLADVVREFNRYNETKLVIADPSIAADKISANVKTNDYESFLQLAEFTLKLHVDRKGSVILITRGNGTK